MKKIKVLTSITAIASLAGMVGSLSSCACKQEEKQSDRNILVDVSLADQIILHSEKDSSDNQKVKLTCKDDTKFIPKIKWIIIGEYVLEDNQYSFDTKTQTIVIKKNVMDSHPGWVTIIPQTPQTIEVVSIKVTKKPTKLSYRIDDYINLDGMVVTGECNDGNDREITSGYTTNWDGKKFDKLGKETVIVSYQDKTDSFEVEVVDGIVITLVVDSAKGECNTDKVQFGQPKTFAEAMEGVIVTPKTGYKFEGEWLDKDNNPIEATTTVSASMTATANIVPDQPMGEATISFEWDPTEGDCNHESIVCTTPILFKEATKGVVATPNEGYTFEGWKDKTTGTIVSDTTPVVSDLNVVASFVQKEQPTVVDYLRYNPVYEKGEIVSYEVEWNPDITPPENPVEVTIKDNIDGIPVTKIADGDLTTFSGSFFMNQYISKVNIPSSIEEIGDYSFIYCLNLKEVVFADNSKLTKIGDECFEMNINLENINIPNSLKQLGVTAFMGCEKLYNIDSSTKLVYIKQDKNGTNDYFILAGYDNTQTNSTVNEDVLINEQCKFLNSTYGISQKVATQSIFKNLIVPKNTISISEKFIIEDVDNILETINFSNCEKLEYISSGAFADCIKVDKVVIPKDTKLLGNPCINMKNTEITFETGSKYKKNEDDNFVWVYEELDDKTKSLISFKTKDTQAVQEGIDYTIPLDFTKLDNYCFAYAQLNNIILPENNKINKIGVGAFYHSSIKEIDFTNWIDIVDVPSYCYSFCSKVNKIIIPQDTKLKSFGMYSLCNVAQGLTPISSITIPSSIDKISMYAFASSNIKNVAFEGNSSWKVTIFKKTTMQTQTLTLPASELADPTMNAILLTKANDQGIAWTRIKE